MQARQLFRDYCYYRQYTAHVQKLKEERPYLRDLKETPARLKLFARMAKWCEDQGISPKEWLYSLFVSRRWLFCPKLDQAHLQSKKHIPKFRKLHDYILYRKRQMEQESLQAPPPEVFDPNRDLSHTAEDAKNDYVRTGRYELCMEQMAVETFGFHPKSAVCARCLAAKACQGKLVQSVNFDVLALRRGEITSDEAQAKALSRVQYRDK